jgi:hypothetical protein
VNAFLLLPGLLLVCGARGEGPSPRVLPAAAEPLAPCVRRTSGGWREPATLDALRLCQGRLRSRWIAGHERAKGRAPDGKALDELDDFQRSEVRGYLARHPERAHVEEAPEKPARETAPPSADKTGPAAAPGLKELGAALEGSSEGGKRGITPEGARQVVEYLTRQQGGVSPDMKLLLDSVSRDGPRLQHDTMLRLKRAAREAKGAGLELGVEPGLERWLLDPAQDPPEDPSGPNTPPATN